jgi:hypothetical protein
MELFEVGSHVVKVTNAQGRWAVTVDGTLLERWFTSQADAWAAGVHEVDRIEGRHLAPGGGAPPRAA